MSRLPPGRHDAVALDDLRESPRNPREITDDALARLMTTIAGRPELLDARPLIALPTGEVIAGNMRLRAARKMGETTVPVHVMDLDEAGIREVIVLDNQPFGTWVDEKLAEMVAEHQEQGARLEMLGFGDHELKALLAIAERANGGFAPPADPDEMPPPPAVPTTRAGDLYLLGSHRLLCGSSADRESAAALRDAAGEVDLLITDPPYGVAYQTKLSLAEASARRRRTDGLEVSNDDLTPEQTRDLFARALEHSGLRAGGAFYATVPAGPMMRWFIDAVHDGLPGDPPALRQILTWVKDVFVMGRTDYHYRHEPVLYGWRPGAAHYFVDDRTQDSVWEIPRPKRSEEHPTMKPVALFERMVANSSRRGELVYDPFAGSGTTIIACERTDRLALAMELDPSYCDVIVTRWERYTGRKATLIRDGRELTDVERIAG